VELHSALTFGLVIVFGIVAVALFGIAVGWYVVGTCIVANLVPTLIFDYYLQKATKEANKNE